MVTVTMVKKWASWIIMHEKIKQIKFSLLMMFVFFLPFSSAVVNTILALLIVVWAIEKWQNKDLLFLKQFKVPTGLFLMILLFAALSIFNSITSTKESIEGILKLLKWMLLFYIVSDSIRSKRDLQWVLGTWMLSAFLVSMDGLYQYAFGHDLLRHMSIQYFNPGINRIRATYNHATLLAAYLDPILALLFVYMWRFKSFNVQKISYGILIIVSAVIGACFFLTWTRIAVLSVILSFLAICALRRNWMIPGALFACFIVGYFFLPAKITTWIHSQGNLVQLLFNDDRVWQWKAGINMMKAHPWIGVGVNTFTDQYKNYKIPEDVFDTYYASNSYIQMGAEIGLISLSCLFIFIGWLLYRGMRFYSSAEEDSWIHLSYLGIWGALLIYFFHGFMDSNLYFSRITPLFGFLGGLLASYVHVGSEKYNH